MTEEAAIQQSEPAAAGVRWYVVHVMSRYEKKVRADMQYRIEEEGLQHKFGNILIPSEEVIEIKSGKKRKVERLFYPGYLLVQMAMEPDCWQLVRDVSHVYGFIGDSEKPTPLQDAEAEAIQERLSETRTSEPRMKTIFEIGEMVRVIKGPFADFSGTVEEVNYSKNRLWVAISIFGRTTSTELTFHQVTRA